MLEEGIGKFLEVAGYIGKINEDAIIDIDVPCACGGVAVLSLTADQMGEIVRQAKMFRDRRTFWKMQQKEGKEKE